MHRKVELQDAEISDEHKQQFADLCKEYDDIFSKDSADIGWTPIVMMDIDTGDSPPISQRPYNLPLKHADWVQKELDTLRKSWSHNQKCFSLGKSYSYSSKEN